MYLEVQDKTIILPTGGGGNWGPKRYSNIVAHLTEDPPEHFREVAVSEDARGTYYCSFVYDDTEQHEDHEHKTDKNGNKQKQRKPRPVRDDSIVAFDLGIKTLATGFNDQGRFYHIGGFKGYSGIINNWIRFVPNETSARRGRAGTSICRVSTSGCREEARKKHDSLHKASHLIAGRPAERAVVIGDLSQRQMVIKSRRTRPAKKRKRQMRNRRCIMIGVSMALCRCCLQVSALWERIG